MNKAIFRYGDLLTAEEAAGVIRAIMPPKAKRRSRRMSLTKMLDGLHKLVPNRFEHEVNRMRGRAFDSGEAGFSHTVLN